VPVAVVIVGAGDYLRFSAADRELAGWFAQWQQTPTAVDNVCVFAFGERSLDGTSKFVGNLGYAAALIPALERQRSRPVGGGSGEITEPDAAEIERVIHRARLLHGLRIADWNEFDKVVGALAAQPNVPARNWGRRLHKLAGDGLPLSLSEIRRQGWVESLPSGQPAWERLTQLTGLAEVKEHIDRIRWRAQAEAKRRQSGRLRQPDSLHLVFTGGPGTGKTTVARLVGELYREMGVLRRGHLHAPEASELIGMYVGHTAVQTSEAIDAALDGVLFIDEAYRLSEAPGGFGQEAIDTLLTRMDNERDRLVVIVAGYPDKMSAFLRSNPGLPRRFPRGNIIPFFDYPPDALYTILLGMLRERDLTWVPELEPVLLSVVSRLYDLRDETFGNAGEMRNLAQELETNWARRVRADVTEPVTPRDLPDSYREYA
jgi:SpoVK/Ycf46/Vps4 family AAA+-type ATPase